MSMRYQAGFLTASYFPLKTPNAPTIGTATGGNTSASVAFTAPSDIGGGAITGYTVTSSPGGFTGTGASSPITVNGLSNGTAYTFTVVAINAYGTGPLSAASNSVTPAAPVITSSVEYLVIAGGGGGGNGPYQGGGGAGGYRTASGFAVSAGTPITVTVGAGGAVSYQGSSSVFSSVSCTGGGRGGEDSSGGSGGSGGGAYGYPNGVLPGGLGTAGEGNNGGLGISDNATYTNSGGGGGAGAVGGNATSSRGGNGGSGTSSSITGTSVTRGGGGGGGAHPSGGTGGTGGAGGGGNGGSNASGGNGTANTGGGAGNAAIGGSGIVIIRYADTFDAASATTGSPTITVAGGYRVYQWTSSGSITF